MAVISFTIPDAQTQRVLTAYCAIHGWRSVAEDGPQVAFVKDRIRRDIVGTVLAYERRAARDAVADAAAATVTEVTIA